MTQQDISLLLAVLGGTYLAVAWIGRRTGDAGRDIWLALGTGSALLTCGGLLLAA